MMGKVDICLLIWLPLAVLGEGHHEASVVVGKWAREALGLRVERPRRMVLEEGWRGVGFWTVAEENRLLLGTPLAGRIRLVSRIGSGVKAGEVLAEVEAPRLRELEAERERLRARLGHYARLGTGQAELESALGRVASEVAGYRACGEVSTGGVWRLLAPCEGVVAGFGVSNLEQVDAGASLVRLVRKGALVLTLEVPSGVWRGLKGEVSAMVDGRSAGYAVLPDGAGGVVRLRLSEPEGLGALAGERAEVWLAPKGGVERLTVPSRAVVRRGMELVVLVREGNEEGHFEARAVRVLAERGGWSAVEGIEASDEVVVEGAYALVSQLDGDSKGAPGHFHADGSFHEGEAEH
ncbi:MAG: hypothetical protein SPK06_07135 [Kiritimatiellia bacterium]|nr:hypothetical protein [Kiritimatiellia bacterium]